MRFEGLEGRMLLDASGLFFLPEITSGFAEFVSVCPHNSEEILCDKSVLTDSSQQISLETPNVIIFDTYADSIDVAWNYVENAESYTLEMKKSNETEWEPVSYYEGGTFITVYQLEANTVYDFRVKAQAEGFDDSDWGYASASTLMKTLAAPSVTLDSVSASTISIYWNAVENAENYAIYYAKNDEWFLPENYDGISTAWTLTGLEAKTVYTISVRAFANGYGASDFAYLSAETLSSENIPLTVPANLQTASAGANRVSVTWDAVENASGYTLAYSADQINWVEMTVTGTNALVMGLTYGANAAYKVKALAGSLPYTDSEFSETVVSLVCPVDINSDGKINLSDYLLLSNAWFSDSSSENWDPRCDIDGDGIIGPGDYRFISDNWLKDASEVKIFPAPLADAALADDFAGDNDFAFANAGDSLATDLDEDWNLF